MDAEALALPVDVSPHTWGRMTCCLSEIKRSEAARLASPGASRSARVVGRQPCDPPRCLHLPSTHVTCSHGS